MEKPGGEKTFLRSDASLRNFSEFSREIRCERKYLRKLEKVFSLLPVSTSIMTSPSSLKSLRFASPAAAILAAGLFAISADAAPLTSWTQFSGAISSGLNTASPVLGNGTADSGDNQSIYAIAPLSYTLTTVGDTLTLSGGVTFSSLAIPQADQFRFGLYDVNGQSGATGWLGYMASNSGTSGGPTYSRLWERNNPNTGSFGSGTGATAVANVNATPSNTSFASGTYTYSLTVTRVATGLEVDWTLIGTNVSSTVSGTYIDTTPQTYTFNRVGFFTGGGLNAAQVSFSNVDLTFVAVPEPAALSMVVGGLAFCFVRPRRRLA
jgi:hypothetical protein